MSKWYLDAVSPTHLEILQKVSSLNLLLTGGTALALQIGHRKSYDLDFVIQEKLTENLINDFLQQIQAKNLQQRLFSKTQHTAFADGIKVTIFQDKAKILYPTIDFEDSALLSIQDIFATKLYVIGKRCTWRDYVDIASCLKQKKVNLKQGIADAIKKYQVSQKWILEPLTYFEDIEMLPIEWLDESLSEMEVKDLLTSEVRKLLN